MCVRTFSSVQSSTAFRRFPYESVGIHAGNPRLPAQLFANACNGKTRNSTDPRKFSVSRTVPYTYIEICTIKCSACNFLYIQHNWFQVFLLNFHTLLGHVEDLGSWKKQVYHHQVAQKKLSIMLKLVLYKVECPISEQT